MPPPALFKYLSVQAANSALAARTLRWSTPGTLNDPFDVQFDLALKVDDARIVDLACERIANRFQEGGNAANLVGHLINFMKSKGIVLNREQVVAQFSDVMNRCLAQLRVSLVRFNQEMRVGLANSKILCLSETPTSVPMWAHYAENHSGILLEFLADPGVDSAFLMAQPVRYVDQAPNFASESKIAAVLSGDEEFEIDLDAYIYSKFRDWEYEREWRINSAGGREPNAAFEYARFFESDLKSVTFGLSTSQADITAWSASARLINPNLGFYKVHRNQNSLERRLMEI